MKRAFARPLLFYGAAVKKRCFHKEGIDVITRKNHAIYPPDRFLQEIRDEFQPNEKRLIVAALLDGLETDLQTPVGAYHHFDWVYVDSVSGTRIYRQSVVFLLVTAVKELYPEAEVIVRFTANKGLYCDINGLAAITPDIVRAIDERGGGSPHRQKAPAKRRSGGTFQAIAADCQSQSDCGDSARYGKHLLLWGGV